MIMDHDFTVWFSKSFGLFYLIALSIIIVAYAFWPSNKKRFDKAAKSILGDEDKPHRDQPHSDQSHRDQSHRDQSHRDQSWR
ncbi:cbb3-type cytochrome c oxidase subunit 3 [Bradyrhizobium sp. SRL28]|nr:cbb3-type cytochrome c oxidase subunit 3 [Bradyrhizobium sp. SRL28]